MSEEQNLQVTSQPIAHGPATAAQILAQRRATQLQPEQVTRYGVPACPDCRLPIHRCRCSQSEE